MMSIYEFIYVYMFEMRSKERNMFRGVEVSRVVTRGVRGNVAGRVTYTRKRICLLEQRATGM